MSQRADVTSTVTASVEPDVAISVKAPVHVPPICVTPIAPA
jgi:hypothetical protein